MFCSSLSQETCALKAEEGEEGSCLQRCALSLTETALELADASLACGDRCAAVQEQSPGCTTLWQRAVQGAVCDWRMPPPPPPVRATTLAPDPSPCYCHQTTRKRSGATGYPGEHGRWREVAEGRTSWRK